MKRPLLVILLALAASGTAFFIYLNCATWGCRRLTRHPEPELAWLRKEFHLTEGQYKRIREQHADYRKDVAAHCKALREAERRLESALASNGAFSGPVEEAVRQTGEARTRCLAAMVKQVLEVGESMDEAQRGRYLEMMTSRVLYSKQESGDNPCKP